MSPKAASQPGWDVEAPPQEFAPLHENLRADVCVVGAGIAGMSVAYQLTKAGKKVMVLEDGGVGGGQTGVTTAHLVSAMDDLGFEVRDVHSLREHYARTLRAWVANLEADWDHAQRLAGPGRARVWRLYMAASALNFEAGRTNIHQCLAVRPDAGDARVPQTRTGWLDW